MRFLISALLVAATACSPAVDAPSPAAPSSSDDDAVGVVAQEPPPPIQDGQTLPLWSGPAPEPLGGEASDIPAITIHN